jgi:hypothetical protein
MTMAVVRDEQERESSASSATDGLAIPDDNDASSRVLLDGCATIGVSACKVGASDDDNSVASLDRFHDDLVPGRACALVYG